MGFEARSMRPARGFYRLTARRGRWWTNNTPPPAGASHSRRRLPHARSASDARDGRDEPMPGARLDALAAAFVTILARLQRARGGLLGEALFAEDGLGRSGAPEIRATITGSG